MTSIQLRRLSRICSGLLSIGLLVACEKPTVDVNVHGVNYTEAPFFYQVLDPAKPGDTGAGELLDPFAAGGTTCCFTLPRKWRPGIKAQVNSKHWLPARPDGSLPDVKKTYIVEVPPYVDGAPGEIWVLRNADGSISVVSSDFQPDHAKWPGKVKGWPVPSLEYRRERWELHRRHEANGVKLFLSLLEELERHPQKHAAESWVSDQQYHKDELSSFSGPTDPRYLNWLKKDYEEGLENSKKRLKTIMDARP